MNFEIRAVGEGRDALGEVVLRVSFGDKEFTGRDVDTDIVVASVKAYLGALNRMVASMGIGRAPEGDAATVNVSGEKSID